jgi:hypothetical protein
VKKLLAVILVSSVLAGVFGWFVWPTRYCYGMYRVAYGDGPLLRQDRLTGRTQMLSDSDGSWWKVDSPCPGNFKAEGCDPPDNFSWSVILTLEHRSIIKQVRGNIREKQEAESQSREEAAREAEEQARKQAEELTRRTQELKAAEVEFSSPVSLAVCFDVYHEGVTLQYGGYDAATKKFVPAYFVDRIPLDHWLAFKVFYFPRSPGHCTTLKGDTVFVETFERLNVEERNLVGIFCMEGVSLSQKDDRGDQTSVCDEAIRFLTHPGVSLLTSLSYDDSGRPLALIRGETEVLLNQDGTVTSFPWEGGEDLSDPPQPLPAQTMTVQEWLASEKDLIAKNFIPAFKFEPYLFLDAQEYENLSQEKKDLVQNYCHRGLQIYRRDNPEPQTSALVSVCGR